MNSSVSIRTTGDALSPIKVRSGGFDGKEPLFDVTIRNRAKQFEERIVVPARDGQNLLQALKEDPRMRVKTEMHDKYGEEIVEIRIGELILTKSDIGGIQIKVLHKDEEGLPCLENDNEPVFLSPENMVARKEKQKYGERPDGPIKIIIDEDNGPKYMNDIEPNLGVVKGRGIEEEKISSHSGSGNTTKGLAVKEWKVWVEIEAQKSEHVLAKEKNFKPEKEYSAEQIVVPTFAPLKIHREWYYETREVREEPLIRLESINCQNPLIRVGSTGVFDGQGVSKQQRVKISENAPFEKENEKSDMIAVNDYYGDISIRHMEDFLSGNPAQLLDATKAIRPDPQCKNRVFKETTLWDTGFSEEESPIIRCIMDPAFRKIYGAMYGFVDGEEYAARGNSRQMELVSNKGVKELENGNNTDFELRKTSKKTDTNEENKKEKNDLKCKEDSQKKVEKPNNILKMQAKEKRKIRVKKEPGTRGMRTPIAKEADCKTEKRDDFGFRMESPKGKMGIRNKGKEIGKEKKDEPKNGERKLKKTKELPKSQKKEKEVSKIKNGKKSPEMQPKEREEPKMRRFETFLAREFGLGKEKIQEFKIAMENLSMHLKNEIREFVIKVREFFKLQENIEKIREKIGNNWILANTRIKLQKILVELEYKIEGIKLQINKRLTEIRVHIDDFIKNAINFRKNLDKILMYKRLAAIKQMQIAAFILIILKWFR